MARMDLVLVQGPKEVLGTGRKPFFHAIMTRYARASASVPFLVMTLTHALAAHLLVMFANFARSALNGVFQAARGETGLSSGGVNETHPRFLSPTACT